MRYYASGKLELSKEIPMDVVTDEKGYSCGEIFEEHGKYVYELDYNEYFVDELEGTLDALCEYAKENNVVITGSIVVDDCDGENGEYEFDGNEYKEFWGNDYCIRQMADETIIDELKKRGYTVTKNG